jgi:hypothetical protein
MNYVVPASVLIPLVTSVFNFKLLTKEYKILCCYFITSFSVNLITTVLSYFRIPNLIFFHLYTLVEAIFLLLFFQQAIEVGKNMATAIGFLLVAFPLYCVVNFIYFQNATVFNTYTHPVESLMFIGLSIYYFGVSRSQEEAEASWITFPSNWFVSGLLLYFSSTFFLYIFSNVLMSNYSTAVNILIWNIHGIIVIATNLLFTIGFYQCRK